MSVDPFPGPLLITDVSITAQAPRGSPLGEDVSLHDTVTAFLEEEARQVASVASMLWPDLTFVVG